MGPNLLAAALVTAAGLLTACSAGGTAVRDGLPQGATDVMAQPPYERATWAISVRDVRTGELLLDRNSAAFLEPASVTKTFSVAAAWLELGPDSRIVTPVVRTGAIRDGTLRGDLVLVAEGDVIWAGRPAPTARWCTPTTTTTTPTPCQARASRPTTRWQG